VGLATPRKSRRSLRFLASTCVFTGWITLVLSLLGGGISLIMGLSMLAGGAAAGSTNYFPPPAASSPSAGGFQGGGDSDGMPSMPTLPGMPGAGGAGLGDLLPGIGKMMAAATIGGAIFTLVSGIVTFVLFLGLGQACYALIDMEEQQFRISDTLAIVLARLNMRGG
jgi:hypothetical protein